MYSVGTTTRSCQSDARWAPPDVSQCENVAFAMLRITVSVINCFVYEITCKTLISCEYTKFETTTIIC